MDDTPELLEGSKLPGPADYMPEAIQKAVVQRGLKHPSTIYPIALGVSAGIVGALFQAPLFLGAGLLLGLAGPAWAVYQVFFRHETLGSQYLEGLHRQQKKYEQHLIGQIETGLKTCAKRESLAQYADTGLAQFDSIQMKLANVKELLGMKLKTGEITYGRFLGAAEQVSLSVLDNLNSVVSVLKSAESIDPAYIESRLKDIAGKPERSTEDEAQRKSLQERLDLWNSQLQKVDSFLTHNEKAMTEMERISAAVAQWQSDHRFADKEFESAIKQLQELALKAHEYEDI